jgi:hypothetical protein
MPLISLLLPLLVPLPYLLFCWLIMTTMKIDNNCRDADRGDGSDDGDLGGAGGGSGIDCHVKSDKFLAFFVIYS